MNDQYDTLRAIGAIGRLSLDQLILELAFDININRTETVTYKLVETCLKESFNLSVNDCKEQYPEYFI